MTPVDFPQARVLDAMAHAVVLIAPDGVILTWNRGAEELYGWTADEARGRRARELLASDAEQNSAITEAVRAGGTWSGDYMARRKNDATALVHASSAPVTDDAGQLVAIVSVSHDVSERRRSEEALRQEQERLRLAFSSARMGSWTWDVASGNVKWDEAMEARYGLEPGAFGGRLTDFLGRVHEADRDNVVAEIETVRSSASDLMFEHRVVWPDGSVHWLEGRGQPVLDDDGVLIGMVGVGIDIDERKALEALIVETAELRVAANLASDLQEAERIAGLGSWRWEAATNLVTVSTEMARMLAAPRTMSGIDFAQALRRAAHPADVDALERGANEALVSRRRRRFVMECRLVVDGEVRQMVHRGEILHDDADRLVVVRGTFQDITEQRKAEQALLSARDRLLREQRAVQVLHETLIRPEFPDVSGYDIAARYVAAENDWEIGGDWYDAFMLPDGRIMIGVGDVSGHGVSSARLMAKLRYAMRAFACVDDDLSLMIEHLDGFLMQFREDIQIATLLAARLEPSSACLELVSAGHPPPLLVDAHESYFLDVAPGPPLGAPHDVGAFVPVTTTLGPQELLLFFTDGLVERRSESIEKGFDRLRASTQRAPLDSADHLCETAIAACLTGLKRADDVCLLAVRNTTREPAPTSMPDSRANE